MSTRPKRRGRKNPPKTIKPADAFSMDQVFAPRPSFGFLDADRMAFMKERVFALLEDYGVMVVHPTAKAAFRAGVKEGVEAAGLPQRLSTFRYGSDAQHTVFDSSALVISSRIASSTILALNLGEWLFRFVIVNRLSR